MFYIQSTASLPSAFNVNINTFTTVSNQGDAFEDCDCMMSQKIDMSHRL